MVNGMDICQCCGGEVEPPRDGVGGDSEIATFDYPAVIECEWCGAEYCDGDLIKQGVAHG